MTDDFNLRLINSLSENESRSGEVIAARMGVSRTAVWKHIESLRELGVGVEAVAGLGYRLTEPVELLDRAQLLQQVSDRNRNLLASLAILSSSDSTNTELKRTDPVDQHGRAVFAERQTAGRGRRGRAWYSPFARNIYFSLGWRFDKAVGELGCLPLVVALAAAQALERSGLSGHVIKWPNDLLLEGRKLGGCLVEVQGDANGPCTAVMGIGINVRMSAGLAGAEAIDQPWTDVSRGVPGVSRGRLAGDLLDCLLDAVCRYTEHDFTGFRDDWQRLDALVGRPVTVVQSHGDLHGRAVGISERGGLLVETASGVEECLAGEVSARLNG